MSELEHVQTSIMGRELPTELISQTEALRRLREESREWTPSAKTLARWICSGKISATSDGKINFYELEDHVDHLRKSNPTRFLRPSNTTREMKGFITQSEAAKITGVHRTTICKWVQSGQITCNHMSKVRLDDVQKRANGLTRRSQKWNKGCPGDTGLLCLWLRFHLEKKDSFNDFEISQLQELRDMIGLTIENLRY